MESTRQSRKRENELKFIISNHRASQVLKWLNCNCRPDAAYPAGIVCSIYYDTWDWRSLNEKINSDYLKTKIRLRWYADIDGKNHGALSFAEAKFKIGYRRKKIRIKTPYSGAWLSKVALENTTLQQVPHLLKPEGVDLDRRFFPVYQIRYKRYRFIDPSSAMRICFDSDITVPRVNRCMLAKHNPLSLNTAVFELKGDLTEVPFSLYPLMKMGFKKASFSKYSVCFEKISGI